MIRPSAASGIYGTLSLELRSPLLRPLLAFGGKDISSWFDDEIGELKQHVDPITNCVIPFTPHGRFIHVPPKQPRTDWCNDFNIPWWKDDRYMVGRLTARSRKICIVNTLTSGKVVMEVCCEETLNEILYRYLTFNCHAASYTWKYQGRPLDMTKTLEENGIPDRSCEIESLRLDEDDFHPFIHIYFNDDLTEM
ncbi:cytochrome b5 domain-containing protein 1-like isoform X1 [Limulus polyphemus]|uniref:Cytochrome b5 domain-containing protein 1-like isoform X1 n=1 Tax=Limulus polyphemus TaxID=6850 RepID=A0ABM1TE61_LIMPO|nr:cytochrome b5 domain-containing protein 1-like isoform X1 [Limulus polyphemus]